MNNYYNVSNHIISIFNNDPLVNTITFGYPSDMDLKRQNIFPLVNIFPSNVNINGSVLECEFEISCVSLRSSNVDSNDKIFGDNLIDTLNESLSIITKFSNTINLSHNQHNIFVVSGTPATPIIFQDKNILDGFEFAIKLGIENNVEF